MSMRDITSECKMVKNKIGGYRLPAELISWVI